uniref:UDP-3-O-(3-hydroxymyristoyl)glucosamine N-acyltransferase n=1 Tax=Candidatus Pelagibacter sp. TaxID=2024849 RepID=UPI00404B11A7
MNNPFFKNHGPFDLLDLLKNNYDLEFSLTDISKNKHIIKDVKNLENATSNDITFFHSIKYKDLAQKTKAIACITKKEFLNFLPKDCIKIICPNVLFLTALVTSKLYPDSVIDNNNLDLEIIDGKFENIIYGKNTYIGKNVSIGEKTKIGHNSLIESNVIIGKNCIIGSNVIIRNSIIEDYVHILDGAIIGKKGFGFIPNNNINFRYPHVGYVHIKKNSEIGCGCTIDRGSLSITIIGENTYLDNQVHIAHNVKIGNNCIIAGQVGIAGSTTLGDNVIIGGQAGVSGHLKIGNNVQIGGGSGVIKDIANNSRVMGYPAKDFKKFIRESR